MNKQGFTKIEFLVVAGIVGLLGVVAVIAVSTARTQTRDAIRLSDVRQIQTGLELFFNDRNRYPEVSQAVPLGEPSVRCLSEEGFAPACSRAIEVVYLDAIASTPTQGLSGASACGGIRNAYCYVGFNGSYRIQFELERRQPVLGLQKGINCASEEGFEAGPCRTLELNIEQE